MSAYIQNTWNQGARCMGAYPIYEQTYDTPQPKSRNTYSLFKDGVAGVLASRRMEWKFIPYFNHAYSPETGEARYFETRQELRDFYRELLDDGFTTK